jgi:hypothetical protein
VTCPSKEINKCLDAPLNHHRGSKAVMLKRYQRSDIDSVWHFGAAARRELKRKQNNVVSFNQSMAIYQARFMEE